MYVYQAGQCCKILYVVRDFLSRNCPIIKYYSQVDKYMAYFFQIQED